MTYRAFCVFTLMFITYTAYSCGVEPIQGSPSKVPVFSLSTSPSFLVLSRETESQDIAILLGMEVKGIYSLSGSTTLHGSWEMHMGGGLYTGLQHLHGIVAQLRMGLRNNAERKNGYYAFWGPSALALFPPSTDIVKGFGVEVGVYEGLSRELSVSVYIAQQQRKVCALVQVQMGFVFPLF